MKPLRIALVIPQFDPHLGGAERWTCDFAHWLVNHGHEVHIVAERVAECDERWVPHLVKPAGVTPESRRFGFAAAAESRLRQLDLDIVHDQGHGWYGNVFMPHGGTRGGSFRQNLRLAAPPARWLKRLLAPWLPRYRTFHALERRQYVTDGSRLFVALSRMVARDMQQFHGVPDSLVRVVYNGVDVVRFSPARRAACRGEFRERLQLRDEIVFLLVGHNFRLKGVGPAVNAIAQLARRRRDVRLVVLGNDRPGRYRARAAALGVSDLVLFPGSARDSMPFYAAADVLVHPTFYDPCSLVALEALACGLPVITSRNNGVSELMEHGVQGYVLEDPAAGELSGLMANLCDPVRREQCSRHARRLAEQHTSARNYADLLSVFDEAMASATLPRTRRGTAA
jgi:UDP-glucose:(heptosyl)LPS alpha-1,3-glucosyltransferase